MWKCKECGWTGKGITKHIADNHKKNHKPKQQAKTYEKLGLIEAIKEVPKAAKPKPKPRKKKVKEYSDSMPKGAFQRAYSNNPESRAYHSKRETYINQSGLMTGMLKGIDLGFRDPGQNIVKTVTQTRAERDEVGLAALRVERAKKRNKNANEIAELEAKLKELKGEE